MALESVTNIADLVITNPTATDAKSEGDDHIRNIKKALKTDLPNITGPITATQAELNVLDGITASTAELNLLDGVTATTAELNHIDGVTSPIQTQLDVKAPLASPALTGTPTAPTAAANTNTTQIATTAHVFAERTNAATLTNKTLTAPVINSPTGIVKGDVGLGNVDNTSDLNKPISTATQTALDNKQPLDADLTAIAAITSTGMLARTGSGSASTRTLTAGTGITITNGDGVSGNPTIAVDAAGLPASASSALISYVPAGTGAVATTVQSKLREWVSVKDFGAVGTGDETTKIQAAVDETPVGGTLRFEAATTYNVSVINVTGKAIRLEGYGATLNCTGATGAIYKTDHGNKLIVEGLTFTGSGAGIKQVATPSTSVYDELDIISCSFNMNSGVYGLYLTGGREPRIQNCYFRNTLGGSGVYLKDTVSPFLSTCVFHGNTYLGRGIYYPGTGNGTDAGLVIRDCEIMGWDKGVEVVGCDWLCIEGSTIDYNNQSIKLGSQDGANISNNYIGSLAASPALWITYDAAGVDPAYSDKIFVVNNTFTGHYTGGNTYDCVLIDGTTSTANTVIANNVFTFYTRYGINFSVVNTRLIIKQNMFSARSGFGVAPIYNSLGATDSGVIINSNIFPSSTTVASMNVTAFCRINENFGCFTENRGQAFIGSGISVYDIPHGLDYTPVPSDVSLTSVNAQAAERNPYVNDVNATNIQIAFTAITTGTASVSWRVRRYI